MNGIEFEGKNCVIIGPGGVGSAICVQGALDGLGSLSVFSRGGKTFSSGQNVVKVINEQTSCKAGLYTLDNAELLKQQILASDLLINATGVGMGAMTGQSVITDESVFHEGLTVCDVIYSPEKSRFLELAEAHGCGILNGSDMMLCQGARGFQLWTGKEFPMDAIRPMFHK